jgi:regulator of replication initiation timing
MIQAEVTAMSEALRDDASVKELFSILDGTKTDASGLAALIGYVHTIERQLDAAAQDLKEMRHELSVMREEQNHPLRTALQKAAHTLETKIAAARKQLSEIKSAIAKGCKNAVAAFRRGGISALANLASFFRIEPMFAALKRNLTDGIASGEQSMRRIEAMSAEYHKAGLHVKNMGRALRGKETRTDISPSGRLAKLAKAPFSAHNAQMKLALRCVNRAIAGLDRLNRAAGRQAEEKPSVLQTLDTMKQRAQQQPAPVPVAAKRRGMDL